MTLRHKRAVRMCSAVILGLCAWQCWAAVTPTLVVNALTITLDAAGDSVTVTPQGATSVQVAGTGFAAATFNNVFSIAFACNGRDQSISFTGNQALTLSAGLTLTNAGNATGITLAFNNTMALTLASVNIASIRTISIAGPLAAMGNTGFIFKATDDINIANTINGATAALTFQCSAGPVRETAGGALTTTATVSTTSVGGTTLNAANQIGSFAATNTGNGDISLVNTVATLGLNTLSLSGVGNISVTNNGSINVNNGVQNSGTGTMTLTALGAGANVSYGGSGFSNNLNGLISVNAGGSINHAGSGDDIRAKVLQLHATTGIGTGANPLQQAASTLIATNGSSGDIFLTTTDAGFGPHVNSVSNFAASGNISQNHISTKLLTMMPYSTVNGNITLTASSNVAIVGPVSAGGAGNVSLTTSGSTALAASGAGTHVSVGPGTITLAAPSGIGAAGLPLVIAGASFHSTTTNTNQYLGASGVTNLDATGINAGTGTAELDSGTFVLGGSARINDNTNLVVNGGLLNIGTFNETVSTLTLADGSIVGTTGVLTSTNTIQTQNGLATAILTTANGLTQSTPGTTILTGANTYTGATNVNSGSLLSNGSLSVPGAVSVNSGGTLGGTGSVGGTVTVNAGGQITGGPLGGVGTLTVAALTFSGGKYAADINGGNCDTINTTGVVDLLSGTRGVFSINSQTGAPSPFQVFILINNNNAGAIQDIPFTNAPDGGIVAGIGVSYSASYSGVNGRSFVLSAPSAPSAITPFAVADQTEGVAFSGVVLASCVDAGLPTGAPADYSATIDWGDSTQSAATFAVGAGGLVQILGAHTYADEGNYAVKILSLKHLGIPSSGGAAQNAGSIKVIDAPLTPGALTPPLAAKGKSFSNVTVFHFTDGNPGATPAEFVATVVTGDATLTSAANPSNVMVVAAAPGFDVKLSYTYVTLLINQPFSVSVLDSGGSTAAANATITVVDAPTANAQTVNVAFETGTAVKLDGTDPNTPALPLTFAVVASPAHGTLSGSAPNLTYTPAMGYSGPDSFQFTASNNFPLTSAPATVTLAVAARPLPQIVSGPLASANPAEVAQLLTFTVVAIDAGGSPLSYVWDFGDGTSSAGSPATHQYLSTGTFNATVMISNGTSVSVGTVAVTVNTSKTLAQAKGTLKFGGTKGDSVTLSATVNIDPALLLASGNRITCGIGGYAVDFVVAKKGAATAAVGKASVKFSSSTRKGKTQAKIQMKASGDLKTTVNTGQSLDPTGNPTGLPVRFLINDFNASGFFKVSGKKGNLKF